jgi:hypothetical protein
MHGTNMLVVLCLVGRDRSVAEDASYAIGLGDYCRIAECVAETKEESCQTTSEGRGMCHNHKCDTERCQCSYQQEVAQFTSRSFYYRCLTVSPEDH